MGQISGYINRENSPLRKKGLYKAGYDKSWPPIQPVLKELSEGKNGRAQIQIY